MSRCSPLRSLWSVPKCNDCIWSLKNAAFRAVVWKAVQQCALPPGISCTDRGASSRRAACSDTCTAAFYWGLASRDAVEIKPNQFGRWELCLSQTLGHEPSAVWCSLPGWLVSSGNSKEKSRLERLVLVLGAWKVCSEAFGLGQVAEWNYLIFGRCLLMKNLSLWLFRLNFCRKLILPAPVSY